MNPRRITLALGMAAGALLAAAFLPSRCRLRRQRSSRSCSRPRRRPRIPPTFMSLSRYRHGVLTAKGGPEPGDRN